MIDYTDTGWDRTAAPRCHAHPKHVFTTTNGVKVYGGAFWSMGSLPAGVTGIFRAVDPRDQHGFAAITQHVDDTAPGLFAGLQIRAPIPTYNMPWGDYDTPSGLGLEWWDQLVENIARLPSGSGVAFACDGGHGRTGTALAIVAGLLGVTPNDADPVKWIRDHYCFNAVETVEQLAYVELVTGLPVTAGEPWSVIQERELEAQRRASMTQNMGHWRKVKAQPKTKGHV